MRANPWLDSRSPLLTLHTKRAKFLSSGTAKGIVMDSTARIVSDLNVARFVDRLQLELDPAKRASLQRLLLEEEDKFGRRAERLSDVQRHLAEGSRRIALQKALIETLKANGQEVRLAERTLSNLVEIQRIFEQYRHVILDAIDQKHFGHTQIGKR